MDIYKQVAEVAKLNGVSSELVYDILADFLRIRQRDDLWWNKKQAVSPKGQPPISTKPATRQRTKTMGGVERLGPIDPASYD